MLSTWSFNFAQYNTMFDSGVINSFPPFIIVSLHTGLEVFIMRLYYADARQSAIEIRANLFYFFSSW